MWVVEKGKKAHFLEVVEQIELAFDAGEVEFLNGASKNVMPNPKDDVLW